MGNYSNLELRDLNYKYIKTNKSSRRILYYNEECNNLIVVYPCDKSVDEEDIFNGISEVPYQYLIKELNTKRNMVVLWSAVEGTTSDYTIYYEACVDGLPYEPLTDVMKYLDGIDDSDGNSMKYNYVFNGERAPITNQMMGE